MDIQFWVWVAIVVITLIVRANKKKPGQPPPPFSGGVPDDPTKPISFEDLLREIQAAKAPKQPQAQPIPEKTYQYEDYDDNLEEEAKDLEKADHSYNQDKIYETYERAKQDAFFKPSLEETMRVEDTVVKFGQFKGYQQVDKNDALSEYLKELRDPKGFKKAFIMSEILNRKF
jgi:hypothetical protein